MRACNALLVHGAGGGAWEWNLWRGVLDTMPADPDLTPTQARQLKALQGKFAKFPALGTELVPQNSLLREFIGQ